MVYTYDEDDLDDGEYYSTYRLNAHDAQKRNEEAKKTLLAYSKAEEKDIIALLNKHLAKFKDFYKDYAESTAGKMRAVGLKIEENTRLYLLTKENAILNQIKVSSYREYVQYYNIIETIYDNYERNLNNLLNKSVKDDINLKVTIGDVSNHVFYLDPIKYWQTYLKYAPKYATSLGKAQRILQSYEKKALSFKNSLDKLTTDHSKLKKLREELYEKFQTPEEQKIYNSLNKEYKVLMAEIYNDCSKSLNLYLKEAEKTPLKEQIIGVLTKNKGKKQELVNVKSLFGLFSSLATNEIKLVTKNKTEEKGN